MGLALVVGCGTEGGAGTIDPPSLTQVVDTVVVEAGDHQTDTIGGVLPVTVVVRVLDSAGAPVNGQTISWVVASGGGEVFASAGETDSLGLAAQIWTLGDSAGQQTLEARAVHPTTGAVVYARVYATATPGKPVPDMIVLLPGTVNATPGDTLDAAASIAHVRDRQNNLLTGYTIQTMLRNVVAGDSVAPTAGQHIVVPDVGPSPQNRILHVWIDGVLSANTRTVLVTP